MIKNRLCKINRAFKTPSLHFVYHHCSYSEKSDFIDPAEFSVKYSSIDEAVKIIIQNLGKNVLLPKCDINSVFRLFGLHLCDFDLSGFKLNGKYYFDRCL